MVITTNQIVWAPPKLYGYFYLMEILTTEVALKFTLKCASCGKAYDPTQLQTFATCCVQPLITEYELKALDKELIWKHEHSMWRYISFLPLFNPSHIVSLHEGWTPIHHLQKLSAQLGADTLLKDEGVNPTGSFKARGISMAVSKASELGIEACVIPTAGNAGGALSAYCAKAGIKATVIMPEHTPVLLQDECKAYGAELILVKGLIDSCGKLAKELSLTTGAFDMSTLKEPYRLEGKKTMGYEIAEQLDWQLPDVIIYPTGGGTGLLGIWKAFKEMQQLGWIGTKLPRMIAVQTSNCKPVIEYFNTGKLSDDYNPVASEAYGLAVPYPFAIKQILQVLYESKGLAIEVSETDMQDEVMTTARLEGLLISLEGGACISAIRKLRASNSIKEGETVLFLNTGSWYKYH